MTLILLLITCAAAFAWWNAARAATERAGELGRNACEAAGVQWLDHSVHAVATRLRRDEDESVTTPPGSARRVWPWVLAVVAGVVAVAAVALIVVVLGSGLR